MTSVASCGSFPFTNVFIYDWYDGPTMGLAIDRAGKIVGFKALRSQHGEHSAYLLVPLDKALFDAQVFRYGLPLEDPLRGILIEHTDDSPEVERFPKDLLLAKEGVVVFCGAPGLTLIEETPLSEREVQRLLNGGYVDEVFVDREA